jgi:nucleotide-binding universal stress UspA family protein
VSDDKPIIYGYMRAYPDTPETEIMREELRLFRWAQDSGYDLAVIYQEEQEGSIAVLTDLIRELQLTGDTAVVVPSMRHFGTSRVLQEHLSAYLVHCADVDLYEVSDQ